MLDSECAMAFDFPVVLDEKRMWARPAGYAGAVSGAPSARAQVGDSSCSQNRNRIRRPTEREMMSASAAKSRPR